MDFLDACRLDEKQLTAVLTHAGNELNWTRIIEALQFLYPPGTTVLGNPIDARRSSGNISKPRQTGRHLPAQRRRTARTYYENGDHDGSLPEEPEPEAADAFGAGLENCA